MVMMAMMAMTHMRLLACAANDIDDHNDLGESDFDVCFQVLDVGGDGADDDDHGCFHPRLHTRRRTFGTRASRRQCGRSLQIPLEVRIYVPKRTFRFGL